MPSEAQSFDIVVLGAGTGGYAAAFRAGQLGLRVALVDDRSRASAAPACMSAASPPRRCSNRPTCTSASSSAGELGIKVAGASVDAAAIAARRDQVVKRLVKGLGSLVKKNGVEYMRGRGRLEGPQQVRVATHRRGRRPAGEVVLQARDVILATRLAREVAAGPRAGRDAHRHERRRPALGERARARSSSSAPARWASSSPATTTTWAARSRCSSTCRRSCRSRTPRSRRRWSAPSSVAASRS